MNLAFCVVIEDLMNTPVLMEGAKMSDIKIVPMGDNWSHICCFVTNKAGKKIK